MFFFVEPDSSISAIYHGYQKKMSICNEAVYPLDICSEIVERSGVCGTHKKFSEFHLL